MATWVSHFGIEFTLFASTCSHKNFKKYVPFQTFLIKNFEILAQNDALLVAHRWCGILYPDNKISFWWRMMKGTTGEPGDITGMGSSIHLLSWVDIYWHIKKMKSIKMQHLILYYVFVPVILLLPFFLLPLTYVFHVFCSIFVLLLVNWTMCKQMIWHEVARPQ